MLRRDGKTQQKNAFSWKSNNKKIINLTLSPFPRLHHKLSVLSQRRRLIARDGSFISREKVKFHCSSSSLALASTTTTPATT